jgi:hypothetical protein
MDSSLSFTFTIVESFGCMSKELMTFCTSSNNKFLDTLSPIVSFGIVVFFRKEASKALQKCKDSFVINGTILVGLGGMLGGERRPKDRANFRISLKF